MTHEEREQWADDHGYSHGTCRRHGGFWSDTPGCPRCDETEDWNRRNREDAEVEEDE